MLKCHWGQLFCKSYGKYPSTFPRAFSTTKYLQSHYDTLKVNPNASPKEIKDAYFKLTKQYHPDLHPNDPKAHDRFIKLQEAYQVLSNAESKKGYDSSMRFQPGGPKRNTNGNGRPYGYPDFTKRDEWIRKEEARTQGRRQQNFYKDDDFNINSFNRFYSRPHNLTPEEMETFFKYRKFARNNHAVVVGVILVCGVILMEMLFVNRKTKGYYDSMNDDFWKIRRHGSFYSMDGYQSRRQYDTEYERILNRRQNEDEDSKSS